MPAPIVLVGSPTALGGHFDGMERTPAEARRLGLVDRLRAAPSSPARGSSTPATRRTSRAGLPMTTAARRTAR